MTALRDIAELASLAAFSADDEAGDLVQDLLIHAERAKRRAKMEAGE